jgi:hypothetical protein
MIESTLRVKRALAFKFQPSGIFDDKEPLPSVRFHFTFTVALGFMGVSTVRTHKQFNKRK